VYARPDQKPTHVHNRVQIGSPLFHCPADPSVAVSKLKGWCGKAHRAKPTIFRADQIAHLPSHQWPMASRVFPNHHLVPYPHVLLAVHQDQLQSADFPRLGWHARRICHRLLQPFGSAGAVLALRRRERKVAGHFQLPQRLDATGTLLLAANVVEPEVFAQELGQLAAVNELVGIQQPGDILDGSRLRQRPFDLVLCIHAASMHGNVNFVQLKLRVKGRARDLFGPSRSSRPDGYPRCLVSSGRWAR